MPVSGSTTITTYTHGADLYDDMLSAIAGAKERILFESFIIKGDAMGQRFQGAHPGVRSRRRGPGDLRRIREPVVRPSSSGSRRRCRCCVTRLSPAGWCLTRGGGGGTTANPCRRRHRRVRWRVQHRRGVRHQWRDTHLNIEGGRSGTSTTPSSTSGTSTAAGPDAEGPRIAELGPARAGAPQRPAPAGVPDPEHVPGGDRPRRRPHLPDRGLLHPGSRHPAGA